MTSVNVFFLAADKTENISHLWAQNSLIQNVSPNKSDQLLCLCGAVHSVLEIVLVRGRDDVIVTTHQQYLLYSTALKKSLYTNNEPMH